MTTQTNARRWTRIAEPTRSHDGYRTDGAEITDNGGGFGSTRGSGRWAVMVGGCWIANADTLAEAKRRVDGALS